ncbi:MAG: Rieske (2Fe-2S) protein [Cyclobacteriaceae bacterium]
MNEETPSNKILLTNSQAQTDTVFEKQNIRCFDIKGKKIAVARLGSEFYAFDNACPHMDYPLTEGHITANKEVTCSWHNYRFDLQTGISSKPGCKPLKTYQVEKASDGGLFLYLD